jgi:hypothetical protein
MQWLVDLANTPWYQLGILFSGFIGVIYVLVKMIVYLILKTKPNSIGPVKFNLDEDSIINMPEVRDYHQNVIIGFSKVADEIRYRIRCNGFENIKNWDNYIDDAIRCFDIILTEYMDSNYFSNSTIDRLSLFELNKIISPEVEKKYKEMFDVILKIIKSQKEEIRLCEEELEKCKKKQKNILIADMMRLITKINLIENIIITKKSMIEVDRILPEIQQLYYRHFIKILKDELLKKRK